MGLKKFLASLFGANSLKEEIKEDSKTETKKEDENLLKAIEFYKKAASVPVNMKCKKMIKENVNF